MMRDTMTKILLCILLTILTRTAPAAEPVRNLVPGTTEKRIALVIGNSKYPSAPLKNPANDARDMAGALRRLGFQVIEKTDVSQKEMNRAITQFGEKLATDSIAIFFYAGHGMQVRGKNYLIPIDAQIASENSVRSETVDVDSVLDQLTASSLNVVILDACRNNPFERKFRSAGGGLAQMDAPKGTLIAYATAPGKVASDGEGRNGLYTQELLKLIQTPGLPVEGVFKKVRASVARATGDNQIPWEASSLTGDFYFKRPVAGAPPAVAEAPTTAAPAPDPAAIELAYWDGVKDSREAEAFKTYLDQYPEGRFAALAKVRMRELTIDTAPKPGAVPRRSSATDFLEGTWEYQIANSRAHIIVHWNPTTSQFEGVLSKQDRDTHAVGFTLGELVWKARLTDDPKRLQESQMFRTSLRGVSTGFKWLEGELNLERSSADELVSTFAKLRRVKQQ
jgi:uncharacterized caspase-like protein